MPLSSPQPRKHLHTRDIRCSGYQRDDGLWDIEGFIIDRKTYSFTNQDRGVVEAGEPVHEMWVRLTIDEHMTVHEAEASTEHGPFSMCGDIAPRVAELKGLKVARGWSKKVRALMGKTLGCTHITQLLVGPLATTAFQTMTPVRMKMYRDPDRKPGLIDTCHALASDSPVVEREWPKFYRGS